MGLRIANLCRKVKEVLVETIQKRAVRSKFDKVAPQSRMKALQALQVPDVDLLLVLQTGALLQHSGKGLPLIDALCKMSAAELDRRIATLPAIFQRFRKRNVHRYLHH